jgi:hypothetical protein
VIENTPFLYAKRGEGDDLFRVLYHSVQVFPVFGVIFFD